MRKYLIAAACVLTIGCRENPDNGFPPNDAEVDVTDASSIADSEPEVSTSEDAGLNLSDGSFDLEYPETDPMSYLGGNVMTQPRNVYVVWYGAWSDTNTQPLVEELLSNIGGSPWFLINTAYYQQAGITGQSFARSLHRPVANVIKHHDAEMAAATDADVEDAPENDSNNDSGVDSGSGVGPKVYVSGAVNFITSIKNNYSYGTSITDGNILQIVSDAITAQQFPLDPNGAYFVFTSSDITEGGENGYYCSDYCGWHNSASLLGQDIKYSFVGDVSGCYQGCSLQSEYLGAGVMQSPNGDWPADGMAGIIAHELSELSNDPDVLTIPAWLDDLGAESADKCAWTFGQPYLTKTGSVANVSIGSKDYMIQQNWVLDNNGGHCGLHL